MEEEKVKQRWKEYFDNLLNHENLEKEEKQEQKGEEGRKRDGKISLEKKSGLG